MKNISYEKLFQKITKQSMKGKTPEKKMLINGDHCNLFRFKASLIRQSINSYTFLIYWQLVLFAYLAFFLFKRLLFTYRYCIYNLYYMYIQYILSAFLFIYHMGLKTGFQSTSFFFSADASIYIAIFDYFVMMFFFYFFQLLIVAVI